MRHIVYVLSWNRPGFLARTLESLSPLCARDGVRLAVIDNGSGTETVNLIRSFPGVSETHLLPENRGISTAFDIVIPSDVADHFDFITTTADDMSYRESPRAAAECLMEFPSASVVSMQHSPEHPIVRSTEWRGRPLHFKQFERGASLTMKTDFFQGLRPLNCANSRDYDWWVVRDAPRSCRALGQEVAVIPGGALHLGWRRGDSPWQPEVEIPEYPEFRI